jgi:hypothetical protein
MDENKVICPPILTWIYVFKQSNGSEHYFLFMFMTSPEKEEERNVIRQIIKENSEAWEKFILSRRPDYKIGEAVKVLFFVGQHEDLKVLLSKRKRN